MSKEDKEPYMPLLNDIGKEEGVTWSVKHLGGRDFLIRAGDVSGRETSRTYKAQHKPVFGLDRHDQELLDVELGKAINKIKRGVRIENN